MFPKRGAIALVTTVLALVLLLSFKTPDTIGTASRDRSTRCGRRRDRDRGRDHGHGRADHDQPTADLGVDAVGDGQAATPTPHRDRDRDGHRLHRLHPLRGCRGPDHRRRTARSPTSRRSPCRSRGHSGEISDYVAPILASEALQAQSASIDIISGRDLHEPGLRQVAPVRAGPGRHRDVVAGYSLPVRWRRYLPRRTARCSR